MAILWLNSEWHRLCLRERERETETKGGRPAAGLEPVTVCKEILGIARKKGKFKCISEACIMFYPGSTGSSESEYNW